MATISTLAVNLVARTSVFEKGMKRSRRATKGLKSTIMGAVGSVARFAKGLALAAGIGGMGFLLKSTLSTLDAVSKLSRRLGIAHEALLGLRHAGELAGISVQAMDKALETFTRRMGEVKAGSGEAKRGLEALGLSAEKMIAMTPDKALLVIADRIETLGTQAEKAAAAYFLFGRAGAQMLNLFEQGAAGIEEAQKQAKELGITLEGYDLTQIEAANDAMLSFKKSMTSLVQVATIRLAPALKKIAETVTKYRDGITSTIKNTVIFIAKALLIVKTIKLVGGAIRGLIAIYKSLAAAQTVTLALGGPAGWATLAAGVLIATGAIVGINKAIDGTIAGLDELSDKQKQASDESVLLEEIAQRKRIIRLVEKKISTNDSSNAVEKELFRLQSKLTGAEFALELRGPSFDKDHFILVDRISEIKKAIDSINATGIEPKTTALENSIISQQRQIVLAEERLKIVREEIAAKDAAAVASRDMALEAERLKDLEKEALKLTISLLTPAQKLKAEIKLINDLYKEGLITTDQLFKATRQVSLGGLIADADALKKSLKTPLQLLEDQAKKVGVLFNAALITQDEFNKAIEKIDKEKIGKEKLALGGGELPSGRFQEVRSEFVDVAALNAGKSTKGIDKNNELSEKANFILGQLLTEVKGKAIL